MKILEFHKRNMNTMNIIEFQTIIMKIFEKNRITRENHDHEILKIPLEHLEYHDNPNITFEKLLKS